jgi:hypothetical protein
MVSCLWFSGILYAFMISPCLLHFPSIFILIDMTTLVIVCFVKNDRYHAAHYAASFSILLLLRRSKKCLHYPFLNVRSPTEAKNFSSNLCVQTGPGAHPVSCAVGTGGYFRGGKGRPGRDADHSSLRVPRLRKEGAIYPLTAGASMAYGGTTLPLLSSQTFFMNIHQHHNRHRDNFHGFL